MVRKAATLCIAYYAIAVLLTACCNCPNYPTRTIRWKDLRLDNGSYRINADSTVNAETDTGRNFSSRPYLLRINMEYQFVAFNPSLPATGLLNTAYACKCDLSQPSIAEKEWTGLRVYSLNDLDASHPAGSEVKDCFGVFNRPYGKFAGLTPYVFEKRTYYDEHIPQIFVDICLMKQPVAGSRQQFRVEVSFGDGSRSTALTPELQF